MEATTTYLLIIRLIINLTLKEGSMKKYRNYASYTVKRNLLTKKLSP